LRLFRAAATEFRYTISAAETLQITIIFDPNTLMPTLSTESCEEAEVEEVEGALKLIFSDDPDKQAEGLEYDDTHPTG